MHGCLRWFGSGPGNILNATAAISVSPLLAARGRGAQQEVRDLQVMRSALPICSPPPAPPQTEDKCEARWREVIHWSPAEKVAGQRDGGEEEKKKVMLLLLYCGRQGNMPAGHRCIITGKTTHGEGQEGRNNKHGEETRKGGGGGGGSGWASSVTGGRVTFRDPSQKCNGNSSVSGPASD